DGKKETDGGYVPIEAAKEKQYYELSSSQKRFYHLQQMNPESTAYNDSILMRIEGNPDAQARASLEKAFKQLIRRHESLRTSFHQVDGVPVQEVHPDVEFRLDDYETMEGFIQPFDLSRAPLLRAGLVTVQVTGNESRSYLMLDLHHIITDGVSMDIFIHQLTTLYNGETLPPVGRHYKDFCQWQHDRLTGDKLKSQETYWLDRLSGELPVLNMLTDFPRPPVQSFEGDRIYFDLDILLTRRLNRLARETGTTLFILFLATLNVLLYRYTSQEDIVIGSTVAGRDHADVQDIIGLFIETLVLRNYPSGDQSFLDFLQHVKESTLAAFQNQEYPFRELLNQISDSGDLSRNPLFSVMLIVQNAGVEMKQVALGDLNLVPSTFDLKDSKVDFTLEAIETVEGNRHQPVRCHIEYCTKLFKKETMERFSHHFVNVLQQVAEHPRVLLSGIEIMGEEETRRILEEFRGTGGDSEIPAAQKDQLTHHLFEEQVKKTPDGVAIVYEDRQYTYKELDEKANQLAEVIGQLD
ncbi:MAG: non-ribosomal peptide synthetase, partial [bacterium]|nr:non-ribosomal peptide synthetase [bacterium]